MRVRSDEQQSWESVVLQNYLQQYAIFVILLLEMISRVSFYEFRLSKKKANQKIVFDQHLSINLVLKFQWRFFLLRSQNAKILDRCII